MVSVPFNHATLETLPLCVEAAAGAFTLTDDERRTFDRDGWIGPYPLLTPHGVTRLSELYDLHSDRLVSSFGTSEDRARRVLARRPWFKSLHALLPEYFDVVTHPALASRITALIGPDVICWGASVTVRTPGQAHRWHVDIEHVRWRGVTAFVGLSGMSPEASLSVMSRSHRLTVQPQELRLTGDDAVLAAGREHDPDAQLVRVEMEEGDAFIFDGTLWHGSLNTSDRVRFALVAQYSPADAKVEIPLTWDPPFRWADCSPPCVLIAGRAPEGRNRIVGRPLPPPAMDTP